MVADRICSMLSELGPGASLVAQALRASILERDSLAEADGRERVAGLLLHVSDQLPAEQAALAGRITRLSADIALGRDIEPENV
jgi:hypothetical protein